MVTIVRKRPEAVVRSSNNDELWVDLKALVLGRIVKKIG